MPLPTVAHPCGDLVRRILPDETRKQQKLCNLCAYLLHMKQQQYDRLFECQYEDAGNYHVNVIHDRPDHARSNHAFGDEHVINIICLWEREQEIRRKHLVLARRVVNLETLVKTLTTNQPADTEEDLDGSHTHPEAQGCNDFENEDNDAREELADNLPAEAPDATNDARVRAEPVDVTNNDNDAPEEVPAATREESSAGVSTRKPAPDIVISDDEVEDLPKSSIQMQPLVKPRRNHISVISLLPHREVIVISDDSEDEDEVLLHGKRHFVSAGLSARKCGKPMLPSYPVCRVTNKHNETANRRPSNPQWLGNKEGLSVEFHVSRIARPQNNQVNQVKYLEWDQSMNNKQRALLSPLFWLLTPI
ncbi:hypothetical protein IW262DRAFT_1301441 [Armillaria fumosa]|nr:hypothetical protein IW262DRAFT_1301441 [Armillaria fumosa]